MSNLTLNEYQRQAVETAIYPDEYRVTYPALALAGEVGEVIDKVLLDLENKDGIGKEIGGVLWYCAALSRDLDSNFGLGEETFDRLQKIAQVTEKANVTATPISTAAGLASIAGNIANAIKKTLRGDFTVEHKRDEVLTDIFEILFGCAFLCSHFGLDLGQVAQQNLDVLRSRQERGTIMGDGDNR